MRVMLRSTRFYLTLAFRAGIAAAQGNHEIREFK